MAVWWVWWVTDTWAIDCEMENLKSWQVSWQSKNWFKMNLWMDNSLRLTKGSWENSAWNMVCEFLNEWTVEWRKGLPCMVVCFTPRNFEACHSKCEDSAQPVWSCALGLPSTSHTQSYLFFPTLHWINCVFPVLQTQNLELRLLSALVHKLSQWHGGVEGKDSHLELGLHWL